MGKVIEEARGEVQEGIDMAFYMAGEGRRLFGETTPSELADKFAMSVRSSNRRCWSYNTLEFPDCHCYVEVIPCDCCWKCIYLEAFNRNTNDGI